MGFLWVIILFRRKEYPFYFAKACFTIGSENGDDGKKIRYFILGLNSYNEYLRRQYNSEINDIDKIYSIFVYANTEEKKSITSQLLDNMKEDKLELARHLSKRSQIPETEVFVKESLVQKLKVVGSLFAAAIPIVISRIQFILAFFLLLWLCEKVHPCFANIGKSLFCHPILILPRKFYHLLLYFLLHLGHSDTIK
jgi:hypothetical protein